MKMANLKLQIVALCCAVLLTGIAANTVSNNEEDCPSVCAAVYRPVCATDGKIFKEFANACDLKVSNCRRERSALQKYSLTDNAWCSSEHVDNLHEKLGSVKLDRPECFKPCTMIYEPLCVTNGKYRGLISNLCMLEGFNCALKATGVSEQLRVLQPERC
ncbi:enhancer of split M1 protein [Scaptodrosophila lebanonensis]|uniref:Enhancer of split M1 protein n=1 Tax=Drosophila lebanonensis TaxID=7225 RepID=A0A6J2TL56_DROLE|nr:enhancer of split M1 protein [Scaptodrosophila lebanonensis]